MIATNLTATSHWAAGQLARHSGFQFLFIVVTSALAFFVGCVLAELAIYEKKPVALSLTLPGIAGIVLAHHVDFRLWQANVRFCEF